MTTRDYAINSAMRMLKGDKSVAVFNDQFRLFPEGKKPKIRPKIKRD